MLSGATGQFYGNHYTWQFIDGWKSHLNTEGSAQIGHLLKLFRADRGSDSCRTSAPDLDRRLRDIHDDGQRRVERLRSCSLHTRRTLAIAYLPDRRTVTIDLDAPSSDRRGRWFDPANGEPTPIAACATRRSRASVELTPPGAPMRRRRRRLGPGAQRTLRSGRSSPRTVPPATRRPDPSSRARDRLSAEVVTAEQAKSKRRRCPSVITPAASTGPQLGRPDAPTE